MKTLIQMIIFVNKFWGIKMAHLNIGKYNFVRLYCSLVYRTSAMMANKYTIENLKKYIRRRLTWLT